MSAADSSSVYALDDGSTTNENGWAGSSPVNPYSVGESAGIAPAFVDAPIKYGSLGGSVLIVRPPA